MRSKKVNDTKVEERQQQKEPAGSSEYLANPLVDRIIREGKQKLRDLITKTDIKLTKTKKEIVLEIAARLEKQAKFPVDMICFRLTKSLRGLVSERHIQEALPDKYKDATKSAQGSAPDSRRGGRGDHENLVDLKDKSMKEFTESDVAQIASIGLARKVAKFHIQKVRFLESQLAQEQAKKDEQKFGGFKADFEVPLKDMRPEYLENADKMRVIVHVKVRPKDHKVEVVGIHFKPINGKTQEQKEQS